MAVVHGQEAPPPALMRGRSAGWPKCPCSKFSDETFYLVAMTIRSTGATFPGANLRDILAGDMMTSTSILSLGEAGKKR